MEMIHTLLVQNKCTTQDTLSLSIFKACDSGYSGVSHVRAMLHMHPSSSIYNKKIGFKENERQKGDEGYNSNISRHVKFQQTSTTYNE
jgi:hypothetical protein